MLKTTVKRLLKKRPSRLFDWLSWFYYLLPTQIRFGPDYTRSLKLFEEIDSWTPQQLEEHSNRLLRSLIRHAYDTTPFYKRIFQERGLTPSDVECLADLAKLPIISKEDVIRRKNEFISNAVDNSRIEDGVTSGSTGTPLNFFIDKSARAVERALVVRHMRWLGYENGDRVADLTGEPFSEPWRLSWYFPLEGLLLMSMFTVNDQYMPDIYKRLERFRPSYIVSFPSTLDYFVRWLKRRNLRLPTVRYILTSSETLFPSTRKRAQEVFGAQVVDYYGQNEQTAHAAQCSQANGYHIFSEYSAVEFIPAEEGMHEIIGTSLHNRAMPFIRYRTGDLARLADHPCPCGRPHPVISEIQGRRSDMILTPEGNLVVSVAIDYAFYRLIEIKEAQVIQEELDVLRVLVAPWENLSKNTVKELEKALRWQLKSNSMKIIIEQAPSIPKTRRGKKRLVISKIDIDKHLDRL